jgi:hypothetical protein
MTPPTRLLAGICLCSIVMATVVFTAHAADFKTPYKNGLTAADRDNWSEVVRWMEESTALNPDASDSKIKFYGTRYVPYTPYYYLGLAHYNLGNCRAAVTAWETSANQGVANLGDVQSQLEECRRQLVKPTPEPTAAPVPIATRPPQPPKPDRQLIERATGTAEGAVNGAVAAERAVAELRANPDAAQAWRSEASLEKAFSDAAGKLAAARTALQKGVSDEDPETLRQAEDLANQAQREFKGLQPRLREAQDRLVQARTDLDRELIADQARQDEEAGRAAAALRTPTAGASRVQPATPSAPQSRPAAPTSLRSAAAAFLSGDYATTISLLADESFANRRASAFAHLLSAASRLHLYHAGGESDNAQRRKAEDDVRSCKSIDSSIAPDEEAFSPRFVRFFTSTR